MVEAGVESLLFADLNCGCGQFQLGIASSRASLRLFNDFETNLLVSSGINVDYVPINDA